MRLFSILCLLILASGCQSRITGNEGNLEFAYVTDDDLIDFNKPVGVDALLRVTVADVDNKLPATIESAETDDEGVMVIESIDANAMILKGIADGNVLVSVEAKNSDGEVVSDSVNMNVATPEVTELRHGCDTDETALYIAGRKNVFIAYDLEKANGQSVIGYGLRPFEIEPAAAATLLTDNTDQTWLHLDLGDVADAGENGELTLSSTIDETQATLRLVTEADINGVTMNEATRRNVNVDDTVVFHFWPTVDDETICQSGSDTEVTVTTPETCDARPTIDLPSSDINDTSGLVAVEGIAEGDCTFDLTYPTAGAGGVTETFTFNIVPAP